MAAEASDTGRPGGRIAALDMARGAALVAMFAYHLTWDLADFQYIDARAPFSPQMRLFSHAIACSFLFIAGLSLALARQLADIVKGDLTGGNLAQGHDDLLVLATDQKGFTLAVLANALHGQVNKGKTIVVADGAQTIFNSDTGHV